MKAIVKKYNNKNNYELDKPDNQEIFESIQLAVKFCKENISKVRGTTEFVGYRICNTHDEVKYKMPSY